MTRDEFVGLVDDLMTAVGACEQATDDTAQREVAVAGDALLAAFDAQAAEVEALRAERDAARSDQQRQEQLWRQAVKDFAWQTQNADNCRADASRMGDRALLAESLLAEVVGALREISQRPPAEECDPDCFCNAARARATLAKIEGTK